MTSSTHKAAALLYLLICIVFTALFAWLFVDNADWPFIIENIRNINPPHLLLSILALVAGYALRLCRWAYLLRRHAPGVRTSHCIAPYLSAFAINNVLPLRIGDIARITLFNKSLNAGPAVITSTLILERILDFLVLAAFFALSVFWVADKPTDNAFFIYVFSISTAVIFALCLALLLSATVMRNADALYERFQHRFILGKIARFLRAIIHATYGYTSFGPMTTLIACSIGIWLSEALLFLSIAQGLNISLSTLESFFVMSLSTFSTLLPSTPGYIGTFHYLCRLALETIGANASAAIGCAIVIHMIIVLPVTLVGGIAFIHHFGKSWLGMLRRSIQSAGEK